MRLATPAPLFSANALKGSGAVGGAYNEWAHHYNECATCGAQEWFDPRDATLLCQEGRHLFAQWCRSAATSVRTYFS